MRYNGVRLYLQTPAVYLPKVDTQVNRCGQNLSIPIDNWLRQQLDILEDFVRQKALIPTELLQLWPEKKTSYYKPLYRGTRCYILQSKYCKVTSGVTVEQSVETELSSLGAGFYSFHIEVPAVYVGPHQSDGNLISLNLRIAQIHHQPELTSLDHIEKVIDSCVKQCQEPVTKPKRRRTSKKDGATTKEKS